MGAKNIGFVLIHGAGLNTWIWDKLLVTLDYPSLCITFPNRENTNQTNRSHTLENYVQHAATQISNAPFDRLVLATHSIGGCIGLQLLEIFGESIFGLVGIGSAFPKSGGNFISCLSAPQKYLMPLILRFLGTRPPDDMIRAQLCNDLNDHQSQEIISRFTAESRAIYSSKIIYSKLPQNKLYIKLKNDRAFSELIQNKMIAHLKPTQIEELQSGHLPMLSKPKELSKILNRFADECFLKSDQKG